MPTPSLKAIICSSLAAVALLASCAGPKGGTKGKKVDKSVQVYLAGAGKMQYFVMPQDFKSAAGEVIPVDITARDSAMQVLNAVLHFSLHLPGVNDKVDTLWIASDAGRSRPYPEPKIFFKERDENAVHYRFESILDPAEFKTFIRSKHRAVIIKRNGVKTEYVQTGKAKKRYDTAGNQMMF